MPIRIVDKVAATHYPLWPMDERMKRWNEIMAAGEAAKHAKKSETAQSIAEFKVILPALHAQQKKLEARILKLERLLPKPKRTKARAAKVPKKGRR